VEAPMTRRSGTVPSLTVRVSHEASRLSQAHDSYAEGLLERAEFEPRIIGFRQRIAGWDGQIKAMRDEAALQSTLSLVIGRLEDFAKRVHDRMSEVDWLMQRDLIRTLVKRVEINQDDVNVVFRIDGTLPTPDPASPGQNSFWEDCGRVGKSDSVESVPALCLRRVDGEELSRHSVREIRGRCHLPLQKRQRGPGAVEQLGGSIYSLQAHFAPAEDEARLLQGHEPARRLSEPDVRLSWLCVPAEGGDMARQSTRGRVPACSQSEGAESNQANDPAMVLASTERPDPG